MSDPVLDLLTRQHKILCAKISDLHHSLMRQTVVASELILVIKKRNRKPADFTRLVRLLNKERTELSKLLQNP